MYKVLLKLKIYLKCREIALEENQFLEFLRADITRYMHIFRCDQSFFSKSWDLIAQ